jgi:hypothetical protein
MFAASKTAAAAAGAPPASTDPQFNYVTLLLNDTGTNGQQNNTFVDSSTNNFTITRNGTPTQGSVTPYWPDGQWSNYFNGTTDFLSIANNVNLALSNNNFTLEGWFNTTSTAQICICEQRSGASYDWIVFLNETAGKLTFYAAFGSITTSASFVSGAWNHFAIVRNGATTTVYLNGVSSATFSGSYTVGNSFQLNIGYDKATSNRFFFPGYISNLRLVRNSALYTSNFTPSTTPLTAVSGTSLLTCQSNRFKDNSSNNFAITVTGTPTVQAFDPFNPAASYGVSNGGSGYFNGSSQYLTTTANSGLGFGTGDFTVEYWVWPTSIANGWTVVDFRASTSFGDQGFTDYLDSGRPAVYYNPAASPLAISSIALKANSWNHVAFSRSSGTLRIFVDGVQGFSGSVTNNFGTSQPLSLGANINRNQFWNGYITNLRVVKGTAVYTAAFTPPTSPVTAITNTSLLLNFTNAGIYDAAVQNDLVTVGNAQVSTAVAKFGSSSMAFDGSGDYLTAVDNSLFDFGTGDFTIECWANFSVATSGVNYAFVGQGTSAFTSNAGFLFLRHDSNKLRFIYTSDGTGVSGYRVTDSTATFTPTTGVWYHLAVTRSGSTFRLFIDGVQAGSSTQTTSIFNSTLALAVGADSSGGIPFNGYIDDLRITKGFARYTSAFTTPTAPFPTR